MRRIKLARVLLHFSGLFPKKYPVISPTGLDFQPIFIFGSGRNGSTLLNRMLNQHSRIFLPAEQYFLGPSIIKFNLYNYIIWRDLVKVIAGELIASAQSHNWDIRQFPDLNTIFTWPDERRNLQDLIREIYQCVNIEEKQIWGDATHMNTIYASEIMESFPQAKYIFLMRDGRDVVSSFKTGGREMFGERADLEIAAEHWMHSVNTYRSMKKKVAVQLVNYEDLVKDTESTLQTICRFVNVDYQKKMLDFHLHIPDRRIYDQPIHQNLRLPISDRSIGKYREYLTDEEMELIMPIIGPGLRKHGYL